MLQRIKLDQHQKVPWLNGGGYSWNITMDDAHPNKGSGQFGWRFSTANIDDSGLFSLYQNVQRIITLKQGNGFDLSWGTAGTDKFRASQVGIPNLFSGDEVSHCELADGPVEVLNLMFDRDLWSADVQTIFVGSSLNLTLEADVILVFALQQSQSIEMSGERLKLEASETILMRPINTHVSLKARAVLDQPIYIAALNKKAD